MRATYRLAAASLFLAVAAALGVGSARAQEWPQWRGPTRDGIVQGFAAPATWPEKLTLVWKTPVGSGYSSPVLSKGRAWIHSRNGEEEVVTSVDLKTGKALWTKSYPAPFAKNQYAVKMSGGPHATPALHGGRLYTLGVTGILSSFDAATGELKWRKSFGAPDTSKMFCGQAVSPLVEGGNVIVHVGDDIHGGSLAAFDAATGAEKWKTAVDGPGYASPLIVTLDGVRQLVTMTDKSAIGVAAQTGQPLWKLPWPDEWNENIVTPTLFKELLIFSGVRRGTVAVRVRKSGAQWNAEPAWQNSEIAMYMSSPVLDGAYLFGIGSKRKGQYFCLDAATGKVLWATEGREGDHASVLKSGGLLFFLTSEATLIVARNSTKGFERIAWYVVSDSATYAHPALFDNRVLIKDDSSLALWSIASPTPGRTSGQE